MLTEKQIEKMIEEAKTHMEETRHFFGKTIFQKRWKLAFEGYLTALCSVLEYDEGQRTEVVLTPGDIERDKKFNGGNDESTN